MRQRILRVAAAGAIVAVCAASAGAGITMAPQAGQKSVLLRGGLSSPSGDLRHALRAGPHLGLSWRAQFSPVIGLEGELSWTLFGFQAGEGSLHVLSPQTLLLRLQAPMAVVAPFALVGGGPYIPLLSVHDNIEFGWNFGITAGGGVDVFLGPTTSLGVEVQYRRFFERGSARLVALQAALRVGFHY